MPSVVDSMKLRVSRVRNKILQVKYNLRNRSFRGQGRIRESVRIRRISR